MKFKVEIKRLRITSLSLFFTAVIALIGSLWLHNFIVGFNFTKGYFYNEFLKPIPGEKVKLKVRCNKDDIDCTKIHSGIFKKNTLTFNNCFKYKVKSEYIIDGEVITRNEIFPIINGVRLIDPKFEGKEIFIISTVLNKLNERCIENSSIFKIYSLFPFVIELIQKNKDEKKIILGTSKTINPFINGEVSISNIAKRFPINIIFKSFLFLSVILMLLYWLYYNYLFKKIIGKTKNIFLFFGIGSAIFLFLHVLLLGIVFENEILNKLRRSIIVLFILFELLAQFFLAKDLYKNLNDLINYCNSLVIRIKVAFIFSVVSFSILILLVLSFFNLSSKIDYILEWNYFVVLLIFYLLSAIMWKKSD